MRIFVVLACCLLLGGCVTPNSLKPIRYDGEVNYKSSKTGSLQLVNAVDGETLQQLFDPARVNKGVSYAPTWDTYRIRFDAIDERVFAESLTTELSHRGTLYIEKVSDEIDPGKDVAIKLAFLKKEYNPNFGQDYILNVALEISAGKKSMRKVYGVSTYDEASFWNRVNDTPKHGKARAAQNLMKKIMPDIETFLQLTEATN
jgi:hypothetical protein